jgi:hypothetical protein
LICDGLFPPGVYLPPKGSVVTYFADCDARGLLSVPDPALAARQFTMILAAEG